MSRYLMYSMLSRVELENALIDLVLSSGLRSELRRAWLCMPGADEPTEQSLRWAVLGILERYVDGESESCVNAVLEADVIRVVAPEDLTRLRDFRRD